MGLADARWVSPFMLKQKEKATRGGYDPREARNLSHRRLVTSQQEALNSCPPKITLLDSMSCGGLSAVSRIASMALRRKKLEDALSPTCRDRIFEAYNEIVELCSTAVGKYQNVMTFELVKRQKLEDLRNLCLEEVDRCGIMEPLDEAAANIGSKAADLAVTELIKVLAQNRTPAGIAASICIGLTFPALWAASTVSWVGTAVLPIPIAPAVTVGVHSTTAGATVILGADLFKIHGCLTRAFSCQLNMKFWRRACKRFCDVLDHVFLGKSPQADESQQADELPHLPTPVILTVAPESKRDRDDLIDLCKKLREGKYFSPGYASGKSLTSEQIDVCAEFGAFD